MLEPAGHRRPSLCAAAGGGRVSPARARARQLVLGPDVVDPRPEGGDPGVHAGVLCLGAPDAPGHDANLDAGLPGPADEQRPAAVPLQHASKTSVKVEKSESRLMSARGCQR